MDQGLSSRMGMGRAATTSLINDEKGGLAGLIVACPGDLPDDCFHFVSL